MSDLSTEQLKALHNSSIYFAVGYLPFELSNLYPFLEKQEEVLLVKQSVGMDLEAGSCNHGAMITVMITGIVLMEKVLILTWWMSPRYAEMMARTMLDVLAAKFPDQKATFEKNFRQFKSEIDSIDREARRIIPEKKNKTFLIYHPAIDLFCQRLRHGTDFDRG